jgi:hypothetical protein
MCIIKLLLRKTCISGILPGYYVKNVIKHGRYGRGTLYFIFRERY